MKAERDDDITQNPRRRAFPWVNLLVAAGIFLVVVFFWFKEESPPSAADLASPAVALPQPIPPQEVIPVTPDIPRTVPAPGTGDASAEVQPEQPAAAPKAPSEDEADKLLLGQLDQLGFAEDLAALLPRTHSLFTSAAVLDGMSRGKLQRKLLPVSKLDKPFTVEGEGELLYMSSDSYRRYDELVAGISAVNTEAVVKTFHKVRPLYEWAFGGIGLEDDDFDNAVIRTLDQVLATPELERQLALKQKSVMYLYAEPELEALSPLQKQLLRMGPENVRKVKAQAEAIRSGLLAE